MRVATGVLIGLLLALAAGAPALATPVVVSERPEEVALTIYPDRYSSGSNLSDEDLTFDGGTGLALVTEWRTVEVPAGETVLTFRGVAEGMVSETASLQGLPAALVEQNQDFDLLSPGSLLTRSVGAPVKRIRTDRATGRETIEEAVIRSTAGGVVLEIDGRFEALGCGGPSERLVFDRVPGALTDQPTLSIRLRVREAGRYRVKLSYLAVGLIWQANYVGHARPDGAIDLTGWITLRNLSRTTFADAPTQFVAGELEMTGDTMIEPVEAQGRPRACWPMDTTSGRPAVRLQPRPRLASPMRADEGGVEEIIVTASRREANFQDVAFAISTVAEESDLGDYKLYTLPTPTTVAARQTKQVLMLSRTGVRLDRVYRYGVDFETVDPDFLNADEEPEPEPASLVLTGKNVKANGLGLALPGGRLLLTEDGPDGRRMMVGQRGLWATPVGAPVEILARSDAYDVEVLPRVVKKSRRGDRVRWSIEVTAANSRSEAVAFELVQPLDDDLRAKILSGGRRFEARHYGLTWPMTLRPGERRTVKYVVQTDD
jgi:hypothetical protein